MLIKMEEIIKEYAAKKYRLGNCSDGDIARRSRYLVYSEGSKMSKITRALYWLLGLFVLYLIIEILRKIFGGSLGFEELTIGLLVANTGYIIALHTKITKVHVQLSEHLGWHRERE